MKTSTKKALGVAAGAAATGAALAGAYYYYGSERAAEHRRQLKDWANKAERDIVREVKRLKNKTLTEKNINTIINTVAKQYEATKDLDSDDVRAFIAAMKTRWQGTRAAAKGKQHKPSSRKRKTA